MTGETTYELRILSSTVGARPEDLRVAVDESVSQSGHWSLFVEIRMGAGPTVRIERLASSEAGLLVEVEWGRQGARVIVADVLSAIEAADRLAFLVLRIAT